MNFQISSWKFIVQEDRIFATWFVAEVICVAREDILLIYEASPTKRKLHLSLPISTCECYGSKIDATQEGTLEATEITDLRFVLRCSKPRCVLSMQGLQIRQVKQWFEVWRRLKASGGISVPVPTSYDHRPSVAGTA